MGISSEIRKTNSLSSLHHYNHQQGGGLPRKRLQSQASTMNKPSNNSNSQLLRTKSMSDSLKVGVELNEYQLYGARRKSTYFTNGSASSFYDNDNTNDTATSPGDTTDYKEHFRRTLLQMYAETDGARARNIEYADMIKKRQEQQRIKKNREKVGEKEAHNRLYLFIKYIATEQELILQLFIFFPLILTSLYIVFVEEKPLFTIH